MRKYLGFFMILLLLAMFVFSFMPSKAQTASPWTAGVAYKVGDLVTYGGHLYKVLQAHTSQVGWEPPYVPALFQDLGQSTPTVTPTNTDIATLPDLTVSSVAYTGSVPACKNSPTISVTIKNIGGSAAGAFVVSVKYPSVTNPVTQNVSGLAANASITLSFALNGGGMVTATADSTNVIQESNETNNSLTNGIPIPTQAPTCTPTSLPDLTISSIGGALNGPLCAGQYLINVTVKNIGIGDAGAFVVSVQEATTTLTKNVTSLAAGQSTTISFSYATGIITATADSTNVVQESNETNNTLSLAIDPVGPVSTCTPTNTPTNTPTLTPSATSTITCPTLTPAPVFVNTVTSPTTAMSQVIVVSMNQAISVTVTSESGTFTSTTPVNGVFNITIQLLANTTHHLRVSGTVHWSTSCPDYSFSTTVDKTGKALTIVQQSGTLVVSPTYTPTNTYTPTATPSVVPWAVNVAYKVGDLVTFNGNLFKCLQAHTSLAGWEPISTPALWQNLGIYNDQTPTPTFVPVTKTATKTPTMPIVGS